MANFIPPIPLDQNQDYTQLITFINENFQNLAVALNPIVIRDSTGIPRIFIGLSPTDKRPGIWISKPGIDVMSII